MEKFISTQLHPAETCLICTEAFNADHQPVALPCYHIFGHNCIKRWLRTKQAKSNTCPNCRLILYEKRNTKAMFDPPSIWKAMGEQPPERLNIFMKKIWSGLQVLWQQYPDGKFTVTEILDQAIIPALIRTANSSSPRHQRNDDPLLDCYNLIAASWDSLNRPDVPIGLAIPLVRLARLMSSVSSSLPKWLTTVSRTNRLIWKANACIGINEADISWEFILEASQKPAGTRYAALLHLYTMAISQGIARSPKPTHWFKRRHEIMNFVVEQCCKKIGGVIWTGKPSNDFKDVLVLVYEVLRRYQLVAKELSLRGYEDEEEVVKGIWALASWSAHKA